MLEILLIIAVWKRGWGPRALLPTLFTGAVAFLIGASSPRPDPGVLVVLVLVDLAALIAMVCNPRQAVSPPVRAEGVESAADNAHPEVLS